MEDLQLASLEAGSDITLSRGTNVISGQGLMLAALNDITDSVMNWFPENLIEVEE